MCAQEQDREEIAQARARWENDQRKIPAGKLVFIDETGTNTQMSRRYGRCAKKQRLIGKAPWGQWKTTTFVAALRSKGLTAPRVLDGPLNGESFRAWVRQCLLPTLRPGDGVVMDNQRLIKLVASVKPLKALEQHDSIYPLTLLI